MAKIRSGKRLLELVGDYIRETRSADSKKPLFPNIAGFAKFAGITPRTFAELGERFPEEYGIVLAAFEDAALNSGATATLIGMYLRRYGIWSAEEDDGIVCEHDIAEDGI